MGQKLGPTCTNLFLYSPVVLLSIVISNLVMNLHQKWLNWNNFLCMYHIICGKLQHDSQITYKGPRLWVLTITTAKTILPSLTCWNSYNLQSIRLGIFFKFANISGNLKPNWKLLLSANEGPAGYKFMNNAEFKNLILHSLF